MQPTNSTHKKWFITALVILLIIGGTYLFMRRNSGSDQPSSQQTKLTQSSDDQSNNDQQANDQSSNDTNSNTAIPPTLQLTVAFTPQAPTANWDELHNEACEEASAIMANAYFTGITSLPPAIVEKQIDKLTKWQQDQFGYHLSINTQEAAQMIEANYGLHAEIVTISEQTIKQALADGKLVLIPANGQMLGNPNYKQPGPIYHMFVITGYNTKQFITNDPGTRNGYNYKYSYATIEAANGNWNHEAGQVDLTDKKIILVSK